MHFQTDQTLFNKREKSSSQNNLLSLNHQGTLKANTQAPNKFYVSLGSGTISVLNIEKLAAPKLSFKLGYIFWDTPWKNYF